MADQKLTALTALATLSADDIFYVVDDPAGAATSHKLAASVLDARYLQVANNLSDLANVVTARGNLGLGSAAVQNSSAFATAAEGALAATALQPADIGVMVQAWDADLDTIAGLAKTDGNFIVGDGAAWVVESGATARASLGLGSIATLNSPLPIANGGSGQTTAQAAIDALANVAAATNEHVLTKDTATGNAIFKAAPATGAPVGATYIVQTPDGTLTNEQALSALATGILKNTTTTGVLSIAAQGTDYYAPGGTDVAIADGGTGQSTAQAAIDALTAVAGATNEHVLTKDTATGNAIFKASGAGTSLPVADTQTLVMGSADNTKLLRFEIDGFTAGATRVLTPPNANATIAGLEIANIFTAVQTISTESSGSPFFANVIVQPPVASANPDVSVGLESRRLSTTQRWFFGTGSGAGTTNNNFRIVDLTGGGSQTDRFNILPSGVVAIGGLVGSGSVATIAGAVLTVSANKTLGINTGTFEPTTNIIYLVDESSVTAAVRDTVLLNIRSTGTPAAGFGSALYFELESATTINRAAGRLSFSWATATDASRKALSRWTVYDTAEREGIRIEASGTAPMLGFLGATAIARPTTYTLAATATRTMPTPEATFTGQDNAQGGSVYAKSADLITLQTRLDAVEGVLRQLIIDLASTSGYGLLVAS